MNKWVMPDCYVDSVYDLSPQFFKERGIKVVALDIDNTLVLPHTKKPDERANRFLDEMRDGGISFFYISNNKKERIEEFNDRNLFAIHRAGKPFVYSYKRALLHFGVKKEEMAAVGDQIYSDVVGARRAGLFTVLVKPIKVGGEGWFVWLKRKLEKGVIKRLTRGIDI